MTAIVSRSAEISPCGTYRYHLRRDFARPQTFASLGYVLLYVMINPSTADSSIDDATIRKCSGFTRHIEPPNAQSFGVWAAFEVVNLFAYRATDVKDLMRAHDVRRASSAYGVVGPENDEWILRAAQGAHRIVVAWGAKSGRLGDMVQARVERVLPLLRATHGAPLLCLGVSKGGDPIHPLMAPYRAPQVWPGRAA